MLMLIVAFPLLSNVNLSACCTLQGWAINRNSWIILPPFARKKFMMAMIILTQVIQLLQYTKSISNKYHKKDHAINKYRGV